MSMQNLSEFLLKPSKILLSILLLVHCGALLACFFTFPNLILNGILFIVIALNFYSELTKCYSKYKKTLMLKYQNGFWYVENSKYKLGKHLFVSNFLVILEFTPCSRPSPLKKIFIPIFIDAISSEEFRKLRQLILLLCY